VPRHSAKPCFAESQALPSDWHSAKPPLPSALFCRVRHSAKYCFAECPNKKHSAKSQALGKVQFSSSVGNCKKLTLLHLSFNAFTSSIPKELAGLEAIAHFAVEGNKLSGRITDWIQN